MAPRDDLEYEIVAGEDNFVIGVVRCRKDCTFSEIRYEIVDDGVIEYPFEFLGIKGHPLNPKQEQKWIVTTTTVAVKRKLDKLEIETFGSSVVEKAPNVGSIGEHVEEPMHKRPRVESVSESVERCISVDPVVLESWEKKVNSLMDQFVGEKLSLQVSSEKEKPQIKILCEICGITYGTGEISLASRTILNFRNSHMKSAAHQRNILAVGNSQILSCNDEATRTTVVGDRLKIEQAIKLLNDFNKTQDPDLFKVVEGTLAEYEDKTKVKVECTRCNKWFSLVPASGNIVSSLNEHMKSKKHITSIDEALHNTSRRTGTIGRPKKPTTEMLGTITPTSFDEAATLLQYLREPREGSLCEQPLGFSTS